MVAQANNQRPLAETSLLHPERLCRRSLRRFLQLERQNRSHASDSDATENQWHLAKQAPPANHGATSPQMNQQKSTLYLIDSSIYIFRAWHLLPDSIVCPEGHAVNALYGFADFLAQVTEQVQPTHLVCAFDQSLKTSARNSLYPPYKANRDPAPANLKRQFELCRQFSEKCGFAQFSHPQFEADDIIGTLAEVARQDRFRNCILSADKDLTQFIGEHDQYWNFAKKQRQDYRGIIKQFGVRPDQIADMLAICGDKVDNIPGIPGVGAATAAKLLAKWENLDNLFAHVEEVTTMKFRGAARVSTLLADHEATVRTARQLTGLLPVPDLPHNINGLMRKSIDLANLTEFMTQHGFGETRQARLLGVFC